MATIEAKKDTIAKMLERLEDEQFVDIILQLMLRNQQTNLPLTKEEIQGIYDAMEQVQRGEYITLEQAKERFAKWLK